MIRTLLCWLGWHGPDIYGWRGHPAASRTAPFERTCTYCGTVWRGGEVEINNVRTLGGWVEVK